MRKIFFFVMMQIVVSFAMAQNFNQKLLKECVDGMNLVYSYVSTDEMQMAVSYDYKNLVYSINSTENMPDFWKDEDSFRTSVKLLLVSNSSMLGSMGDIKSLLAILEEENISIEYRFTFAGISKTFVVSPSGMLNIMTKNFKGSEKRDFVDWFAKYLEYGAEAENAKGKSFYDERTKTIEVEYRKEEWSDLELLLLQCAFLESDSQKELSASFDGMFSGNGREMMKFFYDCGVHTVNIRYSNGNESATVHYSLQGSVAFNGERVYEL